MVSIQAHQGFNTQRLCTDIAFLLSLLLSVYPDGTVRVYNIPSLSFGQRQLINFFSIHRRSASASCTHQGMIQTVSHPPLICTLSFLAHPAPIVFDRQCTNPRLKDGRQCKASRRVSRQKWNPALLYGVSNNAHSALPTSAVLLSVLSMLAEPNVESGANIDACVSTTLTRDRL